MPDAAAGPSAEALLTRVPLFTGLGRVELARLAAHLEPVDVEPGAEVIRQGDPGASLYVGERGVFAVLVSTAQSPAARVATLAAGEVFGEMALLTDEPRSATVRADTAGRVLRLPRDRFLEMLRREPGAFLAVTTTLSRRLAAQIESEQYLGAALARALHDCRPILAPRCSTRALDELSDDALRALFGVAADRVRADYLTIRIHTDGPTRAGLRSLRHRVLRSEGWAAFDTRVARITERLIAVRSVASVAAFVILALDLAGAL